MHRGDTFFEFLNKEPPATAWICSSKDYLTLLPDMSTAGFRAPHEKDKVPVSEQMQASLGLQKSQHFTSQQAQPCAELRSSSSSKGT